MPRAKATTLQPSQGRTTGISHNATNGSIPRTKSRMNICNTVLLVATENLLNSSCILSSILSETTPAPLLVNSIAAPVATAPTKPAGVNFQDL